MSRLALVVLTALLLLPATAPAAEQPKAGGTYRYPLRYSPRTLDPARSTDTFTVTVVQQLFDGLVDVDRDLNVVPAVARSWRVSRDGRVYTFDLRDGVRFHNGRTLVADDVVYSFTRLLRPESSVAPQFEVIAGASELREGKASALRGVRALSARQVEITLAEPYSPFLSLLAAKSAKIVPREAVEAKEPSFERAPVGTGAFRFVRWEEGKEIELEANPTHFRGRPHLDRIAYAIMPSASDADVFKMMREGALDEAPIPADQRDEALTARDIRVVRRPVLGVQFWGFQLGRPEWRDRRVREALLVALDRTSIVNVGSRGKHRPTAGLLPPGLPGYNPDRPVPPPDLGRAAALLRDVGGDRPTALEPWSAIRTELARTEMEAFAELGRQLGFTVEARYADDWPQFQRFLTEGRMSLFRYAWFADFPDPDNVLGVLFHSKSRYNYMRYASAEVDRLLEDGRRRLDPVARAAIYRRAEAKILDDLPVIPILHFWYEQAYRPYVQGVEVSALGAPYVPMRKVWLDRP